MPLFEARRGHSANAMMGYGCSDNFIINVITIQEEASLRAEAEAPFRSFRIVVFGFGAVSAVLATLFSIPTLIGALGGAPNAKPLTEALQDIVINVGALAGCGLLLRGDLKARDKQMARLMR